MTTDGYDDGLSAFEEREEDGYMHRSPTSATDGAANKSITDESRETDVEDNDNILETASLHSQADQPTANQYEAMNRAAQKALIALCVQHGVDLSQGPALWAAQSAVMKMKVTQQSDQSH